MILTFLSSCKTYPLASENPYLDGCTIKGQYGEPSNDLISNYLKNLKQEVSTKFNLSNNLNEILYSSTADGGDGIHEISIVYFNEQEIIPVRITFHYVNRIATTREIKKQHLTKKQHGKLLNLFQKAKEYGQWNLCVECFSGTTEQRLVFYIKEGDTYLYFSYFENFHFYKNPSIGIDDNILEIVSIIESIE